MGHEWGCGISTLEAETLDLEDLSRLGRGVRDGGLSLELPVAIARKEEPNFYLQGISGNWERLG